MEIKYFVSDPLYKGSAEGGKEIKTQVCYKHHIIAKNWYPHSALLLVVSIQVYHSLSEY